jgi:hypothetical protein
MLALTAPALADSPAAHCPVMTLARLEAQASHKPNIIVRQYVGHEANLLMKDYNSTAPVTHEIADKVITLDLDEEPQLVIAQAYKGCVVYLGLIGRMFWKNTLAKVLGDRS